MLKYLRWIIGISCIISGIGLQYNRDTGPLKIIAIGVLWSTELGKGLFHLLVNHIAQCAFKTFLSLSGNTIQLVIFPLDIEPHQPGLLPESGLDIDERVDGIVIRNSLKGKRSFWHPVSGVYDSKRPSVTSDKIKIIGVVHIAWFRSRTAIGLDNYILGQIPFPG